MKGKILKVFALIFCVALLLTGCATVSKVKINGKEAYFKELQYYQGQVMRVGDYLYYGNSYISSSDEGFNYKNASKKGYLARINITKPLSYDSKIEDDKKAISSPKGIEKVSDKKLVGYQNQDMYALGKYIYFTSANTHKSSSLENDYAQVSLFRIKFDGSGLKELAKDKSFKVDDKGAIKVLKGSDNKYYYVIIESTDDSKFTIKTIQIGDKIGKLKTLVTDATSYCLPDKNSTINEIYFTKDSEFTLPTSSVKTLNFATGKISDVDEGVAGSTTQFLGRVGDVVFYAYTDATTKVQEIFNKDVSKTDNYFQPSTKPFYPATTISNIYKSGEGYVFKTSSNALVYRGLGEIHTLMESDTFTDILFVTEDWIYTSSSTSIKRISTVDNEVEDIVTLTDEELISGKCGFDGQYIYFYSQISKSSEEDAQNDSNYYMHRADLNGNVQMIGKQI